MSPKRLTIKLGDRNSIALRVVLSVAFAVLGMALYQDKGYKYVLLAAGAGILMLLWLGDLKRLCNLPSLFLGAYACFSMLTLFWAVSGKFFLQRYAVTFTAVFFFLYAVLRGRGSLCFTRRVLAVCAAISTIYAVLGVEAASTGAFKALAAKLLGETTAAQMSLNGRLWGVFGNPNIESSFYALGMLYCVALICGGENKRSRALWSAALAVNVFAMVLGVSVGAIMCFAVAAIVYLLLAGKDRVAVLMRMINGAVCGGLCAIAAAALYTRTPVLMLLFLCVCATMCAVIEFVAGEKLTAVVEVRQRTVIGVLLGIVVLATVYFIAGTRISAPVTFDAGATRIDRQLSLEPGEHTLELEIEPGTDVLVAVYSYNRMQQMTEQAETLFYGNTTKAVFAVPEDRVACSVTLVGSEGGTIYSARVDGKKQIVLTYRIFPEFIASRFMNVGGNRSLIQRLAFAGDGLKLFRLSPIVGLGSGAFETAVTFVQDYEYETVHTHNQFIETLLESGVIGFTLFVGTLITLTASLLKSRGKTRQGALSWAYPALCAEFVMSTLQMLWDVTMMVTVFACMIYALYGLIVSTCAEPLTMRHERVEEGKKKNAAAKAESDVGIRIVSSVMPLFFAVSVGLNIHAQRLIREPVETLDQFMANLATAAKMDLYEKNDSKLSYVQAQMENDEDGVYRAQADEYAAQLSKVQSNSMPYILTVYYLNTQQYELAIEEAMTGARWSASDSKMWNNCADALKQMFIDSGAASPLLSDDGTLLHKLGEYRDLLTERDAASLKPIALNENSVAFFKTLTALLDCNGDKDAMLAVLTGTV